MEQESNGNNSCFFIEKCRQINSNGKIGVKDMIIYTASCRPKNRR